MTEVLRNTVQIKWLFHELCKVKKNLLFLLLISFVTYSCVVPERRCEDFKTGTFTFEEFVGGELKTTTFVRNDSIEIDYYDEKIDISDADREREESHSYHLYSLIVHEGYSTNQGHYYAFVKHQDSNLWYRYDDDNVKLIGPDLSSVKR